jgi:hypothetical protein
MKLPEKIPSFEKSFIRFIIKDYFQRHYHRSSDFYDDLDSFFDDPRSLEVLRRVKEVIVEGFGEFKGHPPVTVSDSASGAPQQSTNAPSKPVPSGQDARWKDLPSDDKDEFWKPDTAQAQNGDGPQLWSPRASAGGPMPTKANSGTTISR